MAHCDAGTEGASHAAQPKHYTGLAARRSRLDPGGKSGPGGPQSQTSPQVLTAGRGRDPAVPAFSTWSSTRSPQLGAGGHRRACPRFVSRLRVTAARKSRCTPGSYPRYARTPFAVSSVPCGCNQAASSLASCLLLCPPHPGEGRRMPSPELDTAPRIASQPRQLPRGVVRSHRTLTSPPLRTSLPQAPAAPARLVPAVQQPRRARAAPPARSGRARTRGIAAFQSGRGPQRAGGGATGGAGWLAVGAGNRRERPAAT